MLLIVLFAHSVLRWAVLACAAWAAFAALSGLRGQRAFTRKARVPGVVLAGVADVQLLLGLSMWLWLSPHAITAGGRSHYWSFVHPLAGIAVVALVHIGSVKARRTLDDAGRWRTSFQFYGTALIVAVLGVPWPLFGMGRALLPF